MLVIYRKVLIKGAFTSGRPSPREDKRSKERSLKSRQLKAQLAAHGCRGALHGVQLHLVVVRSQQPV